MFLHTPTFKKLLKNAYSTGGFVVGDDTENGIVVFGGWWGVWFDKCNIPNRIKAAIMEYAGELPAPGQYFRACIGQANQYEIDQEKYFRLTERWREATNPLYVTAALISGKLNNYRVMQDACGHLITMKDTYEKLIDPREMDPDKEGSVMGPCTMGYVGASGHIPSTVFWRTELCILMMCTSRLESKEDIEILKALGNIDFETFTK